MTGPPVTAAMWVGLANAATVAQLVGVDALGLISKIRQAARTARQNRRDCEHLARRVDMLAELLPSLRDPEAARPLAGLGDTLSEAHDLLVSCQARGRAYEFLTASRKAERFREVERKIDSYLLLFPVISHIGIARRLDGTSSGSASPLVRSDTTRMPEPVGLSPFHASRFAQVCPF